MIIDLPSTTTQAISKKLVRLRQDVGSMALSRVLTLVVIADEADIDDAVEIANDASHQHPCRIVAVASGNTRGKARLDAQIRLGGDAGASEVVVLRLYGPLVAHARSVVIPLLLPDSPVVAWWPKDPPKSPAHDPVGAMAQRRITDVAQLESIGPALKTLARSYSPGDTDLAWSRVTLWRGLLASALDRAPFEPVTSATVTGAGDSPSTDLLAGWLQHRLRCPVSVVRSRDRSGIISVRLERRSGIIDLVRPQDGETATMDQTGQPQRAIALAHRSDAECLADELRRLDADEVYEDALTKGLPLVTMRRLTMTEAVAKGEVPSPSSSRKTQERLEKQARATRSSAMVQAEPEKKSAEPAAVKQAARRKLADKSEGS
ncbi:MULTISPECIES: glucose-6-phosphate dehydrogenase assembly protein OpcA [Janibacter]|uniref:Glucose-6-phosphate dehydrogenase assembly protein OpcA n=1 Tax=Janibacter melonis TaxID=262209 RepID=A0A5P8FLD6_9MICO|nr:glucose-6-phosphate dehydrogenase assembly protein OpcA [Janibacter melonis]MCB5990106.1 glucose-6-phosphate dehydrogenase assembly protein OpcA [Janibacter melonis]QFQ30118.2 glucose-6-phosphate dehydrogenase assembly protein OpcA [Janibacter melonis]